MKKHLKYILIIVLISLFIMFPLMHGLYYSGNDTPIHLANIHVISKDLNFTKLFINLLSYGIGNDFGYGTRLFYPPVTYTVGAIINFIFNRFGLSIIETMKFTNLMITLFSGISMYFCSYKYNKSKRIALVSSIIYITFPYFLSDVYIRDAMAERYLFIFIPMIFSGIYSLFENDLKHFYPLFIIGYVGGILSHFTLMIYFTILFAIFLLFNYKKVFKYDFIKNFIISAIIVTLVVSPFLETLISHRFFGNYTVFQDGVMSGRIGEEGLGIIDYFNFLQGNNNNNKYCITLFVFIMLCCDFIFRKKIKFPLLIKSLIIFGGLSFILTLSIVPWKYIPSVFQMVQFPWRFQTFFLFVISLIAPVWLQLLNNKKKNLIYIFLVLVILLIEGIYNVDYPLYDGKAHFAFSDNIWYEAGMGWQKEYLPVAVSDNLDYFYKRNNDIRCDKDCSVDIIFNNSNTLQFNISGITEGVEIELPRIYYLGYSLRFGDDEIKLYEGKNGFVSATIDKNGTYCLEYTNTLLYKITLVISFCTIVLSTFKYLYTFRRDK